jgi:hypothetical protein
MRTFTVVTPASPPLPSDLALLLAPVRANEPSDPDQYVGRSEGVLLDEKGRVVAFVVRLSPRLAAGSPRTLVSATAVTVTDDSVLHLSWTADQLLAQPRLDEDLQPHNRVDGALPVESQWMPARPNVVPPGDGGNGKEAVKQGLEGGAAGAVLGALAGLALAGPIGALALGGFFAAGGGLAGVLAGASQETAVEAGEMKFDNIAPEHADAQSAALRILESRLRDPSLSLSGLVHAMRFTPMTTAGGPREQQASVTSP